VAQDRRRYLGVDVGGTKMLAVVAEGSGKIVVRRRVATPREGGPTRVFAALVEVIEAALAAAKMEADDVAAIGVGVPGVVDPTTGVLLAAPNMDFVGPVTAPLTEHFGVPAALGNDGNVAILAEQQFGAAKGADSAVGIFWGTGIGGGIVCHGRLVDGATHAAAEIGHMVMRLDGPLCGCGNHGCLEALASRTAIERDLRAAVAAGRKTLLTEEVGGDLTLIKSGALRRCLEAGDKVVTEVLRRAGEVMGYACRSLRFVLDPEAIVLGGGVMEACGDFLLPIAKEVLDADAFLGPGAGARLVAAKLGDDTGALGAVALAQVSLGENTAAGAAYTPYYPTLTATAVGAISLDGESRITDFCLRADGKVKKRGSSTDDAAGLIITAEEVARACKGDPTFLAIGTGYQAEAKLAPEAEALLKERGRPYLVAATPEAVTAYNQATGRKAALMLVSRSA
jgi:glucokinase